MKVVFLSNYYNHHQAPFSEAMYNLIGDNYTFIQTEEMAQERKKMGWGEKSIPNFVIDSFVSEEMYNIAINKINNADIVIFGSAPFKMIKNRIKANKIVFFYSERPLKKGIELWKYPIRFFRWRKNFSQRPNNYLLCSSAYTYSDFLKFGLFKNKAYKWGYFPAVKQYDNVASLISKKQQNSIMWCARFLDLKHPEFAVLLAEKLKNDGYNFTLSMIGCGEQEDNVKKLIVDKGLTDCVKMLGSMSPENVRNHMEQSQIFIFTSDFNEGWGAVLNESMNSACAVVASHAIGATPYLIKDKENGFIFKNCDINDLYKKVKYLLDNKIEREKLAKKAYKTMVNEWNAEVSAKRLISFSEELLKGNKKPDLFESGPLSKAEKLKNRWYK